MEAVHFWYTFEDENGEISNSVSRKDGVRRDEICDAFVRFLETAGFSTEDLEDLRN